VLQREEELDERVILDLLGVRGEERRPPRGHGARLAGRGREERRVSPGPSRGVRAAVGALERCVQRVRHEPGGVLGAEALELRGEPRRGRVAGRAPPPERRADLLDGPRRRRV